jgi:hypothetical protein
LGAGTVTLFLLVVAGQSEFHEDGEDEEDAEKGGLVLNF